MAPDARCGSGKGTLEDPWCIQDALASERVKPGDTIHARLNGSYRMVEVAGAYTSILSRLRGTADRRITVRPYPPDQTTPTTLIRIACDQGDETQKTKTADCVSIESNWVDYYDFEVAYFGDPRREAVTGERDLPAFGTGVRIMADAKKSRGVGNRLINWVVHDTADNVFKTDRANPTDFYGMVNYNYGFLYNTPKVKRIGGHGFYLRNGLEAKGRSRGCDSGIDDSEPDAERHDRHARLRSAQRRGVRRGVVRLSGLRKLLLQSCTATNSSTETSSSAERFRVAAMRTTTPRSGRATRPSRTTGGGPTPSGTWRRAAKA